MIYRFLLFVLICQIGSGCMLAGRGDYDSDYELAADGNEWNMSAARVRWSDKDREDVQIEFRGSAAERIFEHMTAAPLQESAESIERTGSQVRCRFYKKLQEPGGDPLYVCATKIDRAAKVTKAKLPDDEIPMDLNAATVTVANSGIHDHADIRIGTHAGKEIFTWLAPKSFEGRRFVKGDLYCLGFRPTSSESTNFSGKIYRCGLAFDATGATVAPAVD